jgi:hypothetical protein
LERFPNRASLLRAVALDVLGRAAQEARLALAEEPRAFLAQARYLHRALDLRIGVVMLMLAHQISSEDAENCPKSGRSPVSFCNNYLWCSR